VALGERLYRGGELRRLKEQGVPVEQAVNMLAAFFE
jgi:hypothetical protein